MRQGEAWAWGKEGSRREVVREEWRSKKRSKKRSERGVREE